MRVSFFATLREITRAKEIRWTTPTATVGDLLHALSDRYGSGFRDWALEGDSLGKFIIVLVNGRDVRHLAGLATRLEPEDDVSIFPMVAGG